jgi:hypothetical protein
MADAGVIIGSLALASLFNTCIECFEYVQLGKRFGSDYETYLLKLDIVRLRLSRWGEAVNITGDRPASKSLSHVSGQDAETAKNLLGKFANAFQEVEALSNKFRLKSKPEDLLVDNKVGDLTTQVLHEKMRDLARRRQKRTDFAKKTAWALYEHKHFEKLLNDVTIFVDGLLELFPVASAAQTQLRALEISEILRKAGEKGIRKLQGKAIYIDDLFEVDVDQADKRSGGHSFENMSARDEAMMRIGDEVHENSRVSGRRSTYNHISASGHIVLPFSFHACLFRW